MIDMKIRKSLSIILILSLLMTSFVSCSEGTEETESQKSADVSADSDKTSTGEEEETKFLYSEQVEANDYEGWELRIPNKDAGEPGYSFDAQEVNGEVLNDAIYNRNRRVENKFNITIVEELVSDEVTLLAKNVQGGLNDYAIYHVLMWSVPSILSRNLIRPVSSLPYVDISQPYWDPGMKDIMFGEDVSYYGYSDIVFNHYESMATLFYNGQLLDNNHLESPYDLFISGQWTVDKMAEYCEIVSNDKNGDGSMSIDDDIFGFAGRDFSQLAWLHGSGLQLVVKDESTDEYVFSITNDKLLRLYESAKTLIDTNNVTYLKDSGKSSTAFKNGQVLFLAHQLNVFRGLRDTEDAYGIICYPSVDGDIESTRVYVNNAGMFVVPILCVDEDAERLGNILEGWAADSYDYLMPEYFQYAVVGKSAHDANSADMLYRMRAMRSFDIAYALDGTNSIPIGTYVRAMASGSFASLQQKFESKANKAIRTGVEIMTSDNTD